ncbi:MAG TPA: exopolysaccharide biosynthesis protein [Sulfuricaulis sp.]|nr:exopolysaccharide biosynthesis protein [Sulfuricaulis sp.]
MPADPEPSRRARAQRTSEILLDFARTFSGERVRLADLDRLLADRAFGFLLLVFALPNTPPLGIPGLSTLTGIPLALVAAQMVWGMRAPYLPRWLSERSLARKDFCRLVEKTVPWLQRLERLMKPRWHLFRTPTVVRWVGGYCLLLAIVLALPIPLGNLLPAIAVTLISLGLIEEDGLLVSAGLAVGLASLFVVWGVLWTMTQAALLFFQHAFSGG